MTHESKNRLMASAAAASLILPSVHGIQSARAEADPVAMIENMIEDLGKNFKNADARTREEITALNNDMLALKQEMASGVIGPGVIGGGTVSPGASLVKALTASDGFDAVRTGANKSGMSVDVPIAEMLQGVRANTITTSPGFDTVDRQDGLVLGLQRRRFLRELFPTIVTDGGAVQFTRENTYTNNAAPQAGEGAAKVESSITWESVELTMITMAHWLKASKQILSDSPRLENAVDTRLVYGLNVKIDGQILTGDGTSNNMSGITKSGNHTAFTPSTGDTGLDSISRAIATLENNDAIPNVIVLNPTDYRALQRTKTTDKLYVTGAPNESGDDSMLWKVAVFVTPSMTAGKFCVMDTMAAGALYVKDEGRTEAGYVSDDFTKNLVTLLAEARLLLAIERPSAISYGDLTM